MGLDVKDIDPKTRKVSGYFSSFNNIDGDGDMILKGAFAQSIQARGPLSASNRKIAHLWNHNWEEPIGKILELVEDDFGLRFVSQMGRSAKGQDTFLNYQDGIVREHSVSFFYINEGTRLVQDKINSYFELFNVDLIEGSTVTFGANSETPMIDVTKSENVEGVLLNLSQEMDRYVSILRNGTGTDERFYEIEMGLKTLESKFFDVIKSYQAKNVGVKSQAVEEAKKEKKVKSLKNILIPYLITNP